MKKFLGPGAAALFVLIVGVLYLFSSSMQDAEAQRDQMAREHIERAERQLTLYNRDLVRLGELQADAAVSLAPPSLAPTSPASTQPDADGPAAEVLTVERLTQVAEARPEALNGIGASVREAFGQPVLRNVTVTLEGKYQAHLGGDELSTAQSEVNAITSGVNTSPAGLATLQPAFRKMLQENRAHLEAARAEVREALNLSTGSGGNAARGSDHAGANRMAGIVHYHLAADAQRTACRVRLGAVRPRREIGVLSMLQAQAVRLATFMTEQNLADVIAKVAQGRDALVADRQRTADELGKLRAGITDLEKQLQTAKNSAQKAADQLLKLDNQGYPYDDAKAFEAFRKQYLEVGRQWRDALSEAENIEFGTLRNARIADPDNYLTDTYQPEPGKEIAEFEGIRSRGKAVEILETQDATRVAQIKALEEQIAQLESLAKELDQQRVAATKLASERTAAISAEVAKVLSAAEGAVSFEDQAIDYAQQAARFFTTAARHLRARADENRSIATQAPADAPNHRLNEIAKDKDFAAHLSANAADAHLLAATVQYQRMVDLERTLAALAIAVRAGGGEVDVSGYTEQISAARIAGLQAVENAVSELQKADQTLERAERETNAGAGRWAVTASLAAAQYLGSQLATDQPPAAKAAPDGEEAPEATPAKRPAEYRDEAAKLLETIAEAQPDNPLLLHVRNPAP